jgi:hypothetical protein
MRRWGRQPAMMAVMWLMMPLDWCWLNCRP